MKELYKFSDTRNNNTIKYLDCSTNIVIKIAEQNIIEYDYYISKMVNGKLPINIFGQEDKSNIVAIPIPGFIDYIDKVRCEYNALNIYQYKNPFYIKMLYYPYRSLREFDWLNNINGFRSCLKQIVLSFTMAYTEYGLIYNKMPISSIIIKNTNKNYIDYGRYQVETNGLEIVIMDFEESTYMPNKIEELFQNIWRLFFFIEYYMYIEFNNNSAIDSILLNNKSIDNIYYILSLIDNIVSVKTTLKGSLISKYNNYT